MAQYSRLKVFNSITESGLIPIFYQIDTVVSRQIMDACVAGGAKLVEFTNRGEGALYIFMDLLEHRK